MDANNEARAKASEARGGCAVFFVALREYFATFAVGAVGFTAKNAKEDAKLGKGLFGCLILLGLLMVLVGPQATAQQGTKILPGAIKRPRTATAPSRTSTTTQARLPSSASSSSVNDPQQLLAAGQAAQQQGRFEEALRTYNRVVALSTNQPRVAATAQFRIGNIYMTQGKFGNAEFAFERAVALNPGDAESYNNLGEALGELKQYPRALEAFNRAISLDQKLLKAKYNQAVSYDRMGNFRYSEFVFRSLIKSNPGYSLSYDGLAVTLSKAGRAKEAIAYHEKAIALDPREPSYYFNCAISYLMMGNTPKALEQQEKLKAIDLAIANRLASVIVKHQM
jgi:tetratricopeptide (TPR) repeat protein